MEEYIEVNVTEYVKNGLENGTMVPRMATKFARIIAKQGNPGDTVVTWSVDANGNEIQEKVAQVEVNEETNQPGWIVTKADEQGNPIQDMNGHLNQWIIDDKTFKKKYEQDTDIQGLYKPTGGVQTFVEIQDNIVLSQWGEKMQIAKGGFINITNADDMYGISKRDFEDTYKFVDGLDKKQEL